MRMVRLSSPYSLATNERGGRCGGTESILDSPDAIRDRADLVLRDIHPVVPVTRRLATLGFIAIVVFGLASLAGCDRESGPPNIVLIISDDHGYPDFGFMRAPVVRTPRLDRLAAEGILFPFGYSTASVCRPALSSLLTGMYPHQRTALVQALRARGVRRPQYTEIQDLVTLPRLLSASGYTTFQGGKHWEGDHALAGFAHGTAEMPRDSHPGSAPVALARTSGVRP